MRKITVFEDELSMCKTMGEMMEILKEFFVVNKPIGSITKSLVIMGIDNGLNKPLDDLTKKKLKACSSVHEMIMIINWHYKDVIIKPENKAKVISGLHTFIKMTGLKAK